ncbi:diguanylate cyclase (plasmid) [Sinorhizobium chiapasense]|uniref:diguanylate cyclase domain-containing protein n=1 Tax=Sinorhizobium chiapasense TaxID=501572 RepID=UPI002FE0542E
MRTWNAGAFRDFLDSSPGLRVQFNELSLRIKALGNVLDRLEQLEPKALGIALTELDEVGVALTRIGTSAYSTSLTQAEDIRDTLRERQFIQHVLITSLFVTGLGLLVLAGIQNRSLARANHRLRENGERFAFLASHDPLTCLPNRTAFDGALSAAVMRLGSDSARIAVLAIDLDGFKGINDTLGHGTGDALLISVARRLRADVCQWDKRNVVARFGGDEFMVLLHLEGGKEEVANQANRLRQSLRAPHVGAAGTVIIDASVGWAVSGDDDEENDRLHLNANLALNHAKSSGRGSIVAFAPKMRAIVTRRSRTEAELDEAIETGGIIPFYQLQVDLGTGHVIGVEALARWRRSAGDWVLDIYR